MSNWHQKVPSFTTKNLIRAPKNLKSCFILKILYRPNSLEHYQNTEINIDLRYKGNSSVFDRSVNTFSLYIMSSVIYELTPLKINLMIVELGSLSTVYVISKFNTSRFTLNFSS